MTLTPIHPLWSTFNERFWDAYNNCDENLSCPTARQVLQDMAFSDAEVDRSIAFFRSLGASCDYDILWNLDTL